MVRLACCDKLSIKKGLWTEEEDAKILAHVSKHGTSNWTAVPKKAGLTRCGKSCRLRWTNYLRPNLRHESFTPQEEELIVRLHATIGSRWSIIAQQLPGRTDNDVKNYWNTKLKKKLSEMGIDPVTHKPFSQILADYGNIGGLPKAGMRIGIGGSLNKDLKNAMLMKSEPYSLPSQDLSNIDSYFMPTMVPTKMEPIQDSFFNNNQSSNQPFDLLTQLQTIKLVTEASNSTTNHESSLPPDFYSEGILSSLVPSSSSSACSSALQEKSTPAFIWSDFLLEDAFIPTDHHAQEHENMAEFSSKDMLNQAQAAMPQDQVEGVAAMQKYNGSIGIYYNHYTLSSSEVQATSPCDSSFVEDIVARENEMFLELPELMEEPFYY